MSNLNYETQSCLIQIHNDRETYNYWREKVRQIIKELHMETEEFILNRLRYEVKTALEFNNPLKYKNDNYSYLLYFAISQINFYEIAKDLYETFKE